jgi:NADH-quinone oxidoreductase subunit N
MQEVYITSAYALTGIAAFSVITFVQKYRKWNIHKFPWIRKEPLLACILTIFVVWLVSQSSRIFREMVLFNQTIQAGYIALVIVAVVDSIIAWATTLNDSSDVHKEPNERTRTPLLFMRLPLLQ